MLHCHPWTQCGCVFRGAGADKEHNPTKLASVPGLLKKYAGSEQQLLDTMRKKYGVPVPPPSPQPPSSPQPPPPPTLPSDLDAADSAPASGGGGTWSTAESQHCLAPDRPNPHDAPDTAPVSIPWAQAKSMTKQTFFSKMQLLEPLRIEGAVSGLPAASWTMENVAARMGQTPISVEVSEPGEAFKYGESGTRRQKMTFQRFREMSADPSVQAYWANENIPNELADDVREPSFLSFLAPTYKTLLWWGAGGQVTKAHYDTYDNVVRPPTNRTLPRCSNSS